VKNTIKTDEGLVEFITGFLESYVSHVVTDYTAQIRWRLHLENMRKFVDIKGIEPRVRSIYTSSDFEQLDDREKRAIELFIDAVNNEKQKNEKE
jgi:hypothetical protein